MRSIKSAFIFLSLLILSSLTSRADGWPANYGGVVLQGFYWDSYDDTKWTNLESQADELSGYFDIIWVPNSGQSSGMPNMGYLPIYWFTNHNSSFGSESEIRSMINTFKSKGTSVIMDLVVNHRVGTSSWANFPSETWKGTTYRLGASAVCRTDEWARNGGNPTGANDTGDDFDGGRDLDHTNATVQDHVKAYCKFLLEDMGYAGFRLDMVKGYSGYYTKMYNQYSKPRFSVGEYWDGYDNIANWIESTGKESAAFDFPFKYALNEAMNGGNSNMSALCWLANGTDPQPAGMIHYNYRQYAVTFIDNHDTYRNDNKFTGNVLAANAFMLCSPGTPCVFLPHWKQYKSQIKQMIAIRKACGVTNTSAVRVLQHDSSCYMAEVTGTKGKLVVKIGPAMVSPFGYSDSDIKTSGDNYCIWANVSVPATPGPVDTGSFKVYWNNSDAGWTTPKVHYFGGVSASDWPGETMTKVSGTTNLYEFTVASGTTGLVFNNGSGSQTDDFAALANHIYTTSGDAGVYNSGSYNDGDDNGGNGGNGDNSTTNTVYFDNRYKNWAQPYIHYWGGSESTWPGVKMTHVNGSMYKYDLPAGTTGMLFNAGDGDATKTQNFNFQAGHDYDGRGNGYDSQGAHVPSALYVLGTVNGYTWSNTTPGVALTKKGNKFEGFLTVDKSSSTSTTGSFSFVTVPGSNWTAVNAGHRYGASSTDEPINPGVPRALVKYASNNDPGSAKSWKATAGTYYVTVDFDNMSLTLTPVSISLNKSVASLAIGASTNLTATVSPSELSGVNVVWSTSNAAVATVSTSGKVTAVAKGTATITATYGAVSATCTVIIGKQSQNILWSQSLSSMAKDDIVNLTASTTSGLAVTYTITNGSQLAEIIDGNRLHTTGVGIVTIQASQEGNDDYAPAEPVAKTVTINLGYTPGDLDGDGSLSVLDISRIVLYIMGQNTESFNRDAADLNADGNVDVVDITVLVNAILDAN